MTNYDFLSLKSLSLKGILCDGRRAAALAVPVVDSCKHAWHVLNVVSLLGFFGKPMCENATTIADYFSSDSDSTLARGVIYFDCYTARRVWKVKTRQFLRSAI